MFWTTIKRIIRSGFVNFWRNGFVSLSSVLVMTVTLFVIGSVLFSVAVLNSSLEIIKDKVDVNVYFLTGAEPQDILAVKKAIETMPQVKSVEYLSRETVLENFKKRHENDTLTLQSLDELGENPLGATLNVKAKDPSQYESIANSLKSDSGLSKDKKDIIDKVNYFDNKAAIDRLSKIINAAQRLGFALTILLVIISIVIVFNTIRLTIFISRDEISVMRLVGASNKYIRGPFVIAGIVYGIVSGIITLVLMYPFTYWVGSATESFFSGLNLFSYYITNFGQVFLVIMGSGIVLGAFSSYLAVRRYLKV